VQVRAGRGAGALALCLWAAAGAACSLLNREGPDVRCADLACGRINACEQNIIASCSDGVTVKYHVCSADQADVCKEDWQVDGQFKCDEFAPECEGCRPEREGCLSDGGTE
jgi:hypothetical protein